MLARRTHPSIDMHPAVDSATGAPRGLAHWPDEAAFVADDARRGRSAEVDLGATWRRPGSRDAWKLAWLADTGELYLCRLAGYPAEGTDVRLLAVVPTEHDLDAVLDGWRDHRAADDGLAWLADRLAA